MRKITGLFWSLFYLVAIECDMPWGSDVSLGESFRAWTEETFEAVMSGIISNLPHNHLATIVSFVPSYSVLGLS